MIGLSGLQRERLEKKARNGNRSTTIQTMGLTRSLIPQQHRPILDQLVRLSLRQGQVDGDNYTCGQVEALAIEHVQDIRRKIADLKKLKAALETIASQCCGGKTPKCPIDALFDVRALIRPTKPARNTRPVMPLRGDGRGRLGRIASILRMRRRYPLHGASSVLLARPIRWRSDDHGVSGHVLTAKGRGPEVHFAPARRRLDIRALCPCCTVPPSSQARS